MRGVIRVARIWIAQSCRRVLTLDCKRACWPSWRRPRWHTPVESTACRTLTAPQLPICMRSCRGAGGSVHSAGITSRESSASATAPGVQKEDRHRVAVTVKCSILSTARQPPRIWVIQGEPACYRGRPPHRSGHPHQSGTLLASSASGSARGLLYRLCAIRAGFSRRELVLMVSCGASAHVGRCTASPLRRCPFICNIWPPAFSHDDVRVAAMGCQCRLSGLRCKCSVPPHNSPAHRPRCPAT